MDVRARMRQTAPRAAPRLVAVALVLCAVAASAAEEWALAGLTLVAGAAAYGAWRAPEIVFAVWFALSPWGAYVFRFPVEQSLVTFDRVVVALVSIGFVARAWRRRERPPAATVFELAWLCYAGVALVSALAVSTHTGFAARTAVDALVLPILFFYAVRVGFDREAGARAIFWGAVALAFTLPWVGVYELLTRNDLMAYKSSSLLRDDVVRANGPFSQDNSYAIVSALLLVFLLWLPSLLRMRLDAPSRLAWLAAQACAGLAAMLPLFRAVALAVAGALALPWIAAGRVRTLARAGMVGLLVLVAALPFVIAAAPTRVFQNRIADPSSAFSRAATYSAAVDVIRDRPIAGVGFVSYRDYFDAKYGTAWYVDVDAVSGVGAENSPHNNLLGAWAELGVFGFFFYVAAAIVLAGQAWRRRDVAALALMVAYWVPGMTLQSGIYGDLNLYYFAMLGVVFAVAERDGGIGDVAHA